MVLADKFVDGCGLCGKNVRIIFLLLTDRLGYGVLFRPQIFDNNNLKSRLRNVNCYGISSFDVFGQ